MQRKRRLAVGWMVLFWVLVSQVKAGPGGDIGGWPAPHGSGTPVCVSSATTSCPPKG